MYLVTCIDSFKDSKGTHKRTRKFYSHTDKGKKVFIKERSKAKTFGLLSEALKVADNKYGSWVLEAV